MKIIRQILFFGSVLVLLALQPKVKAQETRVSLAPSTSDMPFLGQNHSYSLNLRGNGEAVVSLRVTLTNKNSDELSKISLRIPKVSPKEFSVYQILREPICIRYAPEYYSAPDRSKNQQVYCLEYQEPNLYSWGQAKYQKASYEYKADTITVTLPTPIQKEKSGSFLVYFRTFGYAKKNIFGAYAYTFESLKVEDEINNLTIGVNTDSDLYLKGAKGEVEYRFTEPALGSLENAEAVPLKSAAMDSFISQIGTGRIIKQATNLASLESYKVNGMYAKSRLLLYAKELIITGLVLIIIFALVGLVIRIILKKDRKPEEPVKSQTDLPKKGNFLISLGVGFAASIVISLYTALVLVIGNLLLTNIDYQFQTLVILFLIIISFCVYALLIFLPGVFIGNKRGIGWGIATIVSTIFFLFILLAIAVLIIFFSFSSRTYPYPIITPLMEKTTQLGI